MSSYIPAYEGNGSRFAIDDARRLADELRSDATITDGVIRWDSNQRVPPVECVELAAHIGLPVDVAACTATRDTEESAFLAAYRRRNHRVTPEQRAEMRAVFGPGTRVVNVVTGRVTKV